MSSSLPITALERRKNQVSGIVNLVGITPEINLFYYIDITVTCQMYVQQGGAKSAPPSGNVFNVEKPMII
jgi:hypothetical protein